MLLATLQPTEVAMHVEEILQFLTMMIPTFLLLGFAALSLAGF